MANPSFLALDFSITNDNYVTFIYWSLLESLSSLASTKEKAASLAEAASINQKNFFFFGFISFWQLAS
jgi:hypothetical protein